jgi:hypothetical protein
MFSIHDCFHNGLFLFALIAELINEFCFTLAKFESVIFIKADWSGILCITLEKPIDLEDFFRVIFMKADWPGILCITLEKPIDLEDFFGWI